MFARGKNKKLPLHKREPDAFGSALAADGAATLGTGDDDVALAPGYTAHGAAVGTGKVFVLLVHAAHPAVFNRVHDFSEKPSILPAPLRQIAGEHTKQDPHHQHKIRRGQKHINGVAAAAAEKEIHRVEHQQQNDGCPAKLVRAVAPVHKTGKCVAQFLKKTHSVASIPAGDFYPYYFTGKYARGKG